MTFETDTNASAFAAPPLAGAENNDVSVRQCAGRRQPCGRAGAEAAQLGQPSVRIAARRPRERSPAAPGAGAGGRPLCRRRQRRAAAQSAPSRAVAGPSAAAAGRPSKLDSPAPARSHAACCTAASPPPPNPSAPPRRGPCRRYAVVVVSFKPCPSRVNVVVVAQHSPTSPLLCVCQ